VNQPVGGTVNKPVGGYTTTTHTLPGGQTATVSTRANGRVASIQANGLAINHGIHGGRIITSERNGHTIVSTGRQGGYVERPYLNRGDRIYYQRTYVVGGRAYARAYRGYDYRGRRYYSYAPGYYYHPAFYGWAYHPWTVRVYYTPVQWGWVGAPWYAGYPGYFTPYPVYPTASLWLTDYLIAANMQAAYQAGVEAGQAQAPPPSQQYQPQSPDPAEATAQTPLSPQVKQAIADEVQQQLATEQAAAQNVNPQSVQPQFPNPPVAPGNELVPEALNPSERVFVVAATLDVTTPGGGHECGLTAGDVVMRLTDTPDSNQKVTASVQSSKKADCAAGQTVEIAVQDLQEMHNQFREQLDSGLQTLAAKGGTGNLPKPPDTTTVPGEVPPPTPDSGAANQLVAQSQQADQTEAQLLQGGAPGSQQF